MHIWKSSNLSRWWLVPLTAFCLFIFAAEVNAYLLCSSEYHSLFATRVDSQWRCVEISLRFSEAPSVPVYELPWIELFSIYANKSVVGSEFIINEGPQFSAVTSLLTNGVNDLIGHYRHVPNDSWPPTGSIVSEANWLYHNNSSWGAPINDLAGNAIHAFILSINDFDSFPDPNDPELLWLSYSYTLNIQGAPAQPVPEPTSAILLLFGICGIFASIEVKKMLKNKFYNNNEVRS